MFLFKFFFKLKRIQIFNYSHEAEVITSPIDSGNPFSTKIVWPHSRLLKSLHTEQILKQNDKSQEQTAK